MLNLKSSKTSDLYYDNEGDEIKDRGTEKTETRKPMKKTLDMYE